MPNAHIKKSAWLDFPCEYGEFTYKFVAKSNYDSLVMVETKKESFFLQIVEKDDRVLLKSDKITRPTNVKVLQEAMLGLIKANGWQTISSNLNSSKNHLKKESRYLKNIEDFVGYKSDKPFEIEIGFGSGRHLLHLAKKNLHKLFLGIEIHKPSIEQLLKQCELQNIENIMVLDYDARILLEVLESNSIDNIYIHFPVPWDKKPHRRVISKPFLEVAIRVLKVGGKLKLRTDSDNYFNYSKELFLSLKRCEFVIKKNIELEVSSKYEDRWRKLDKNIYDLELVVHENSKKRVEYSFKKLDKKVEFKRVLERFENKTVKKEECFVHFENIYKIDDDNGVIKLSFGAYDKPEHRYLIVSNTQVWYLPEYILPIKQNILSDKIIKEYLYE